MLTDAYPVEGSILKGTPSTVSAVGKCLLVPAKKKARIASGFGMGRLLRLFPGVLDFLVGLFDGVLGRVWRRPGSARAAPGELAKTNTIRLLFIDCSPLSGLGWPEYLHFPVGSRVIFTGTYSVQACGVTRLCSAEQVPLFRSFVPPC
jgi:hypothetical protein